MKESGLAAFLLARARSINGGDFRSRLPLDHSEMDLDRARNLRKAGMSFTKIASELNIPRHRLYCVLRQITLTTGERLIVQCRSACTH
jgi:hypothetical protein